MTAKRLRDIINSFPKYPNAKKVHPASICNNGFPGTFNLSFTESEWNDEFNNQYLDYDHDLVYSKIQPCIRHQDWKFITHHSDKSYRYLSVFDMADISGAISMVDGKKLDKIVKFSINSLYNFLIHELKLKSDKLRIKYCTGGDVKTLTKGKYPLNKKLIGDEKIKLWLNLGITKKQLIPDATRDSLLALHIYNLPTPWGYRNEIFYEHSGKLIDIATFEYLFLRPIFDTDGIIKDLKKWEHCFVISAIGFDRVLMIINNAQTIMDCPHIKPLYKMILKDADKKDTHQATILTEGIRAVHRIIADAGKYQNLSKHRKQKIRDYYNGIFNSALKLNIEISDSAIKKYLLKNATLQDYYSELSQSVELAVSEILSAKNRFKKDKSKKLEGVAQK